MGKWEGRGLQPDYVGKWHLFRELMVFGRAQMSLKAMSEYPWYVISLLHVYSLPTCIYR